MPESVQTTIEGMTAELETLRRVNGELLAKSATRKGRIGELETSVTELQSKLSEAQNALRQTIIEAPLKAMASDMSNAPELWLEQFNKAYRLEEVNGKLTLQTTDGTTVLKGDVPVPFERNALVALLTTGDDAQARMFKSITVVSRASGASGQHRSGNRTSKPGREPKPQFGLR
ncbi:hypothetical protein [Tunturiibacter psychrotolerans]|uniref:hypothetical protein n=1 Tax=Tunturiibacter psychrotolerans TaxID=3069686 RepID=UPI003D1A7660